MTWTFKEMIKSIFKKTRADIASEKRQRVEADNNIMQQLNTAVNGGLANKVDKLSENEITVSNAKNNESHNLILNNNIAMLSYKDSLNNESQVVVSTAGVRLKEKSNINNNVTVNSTKAEVSHTNKVLLKAGDNVLQVDATDGLQISTDGGSTWGAVGGHLYEHNITAARDSDASNDKDHKLIKFTILSTDPTALTKTTAAKALYDAGFTSTTNTKMCTGRTYQDDPTVRRMPTGVYSQDGTILQFTSELFSGAGQSSGVIGLNYQSNYTVADTVVQIM